MNIQCCKRQQCSFKLLVTKSEQQQKKKSENTALSFCSTGNPPASWTMLTLSKPAEQFQTFTCTFLTTGYCVILFYSWETYTGKLNHLLNVQRNCEAHPQLREQAPACQHSWHTRGCCGVPQTQELSGFLQCLPAAPHLTMETCESCLSSSQSHL